MRQMGKLSLFLSLELALFKKTACHRCICEREREIFNLSQLENGRNRMFVMPSDLWETTEGYKFKVLKATPELHEGNL